MKLNIYNTNNILMTVITTAIVSCKTSTSYIFIVIKRQRERKKKDFLSRLYSFPLNDIT